MGAGFVNCNRNKDCVALNLKSNEGKDIFYKLVKNADAVVHNMRNKTAVNLGIGYEDLKKVKADLVYWRSRFGEEGPSSDVPAYDDIIQAASGLSYLNSDTEGRPLISSNYSSGQGSGAPACTAVLWFD